MNEKYQSEGVSMPKQYTIGVDSPIVDLIKKIDEHFW